MGRKSYLEAHGNLLIYLARKFYRSGERPLRDVGVFLARAGFRTQTGKPFGPAAVRKIIRNDIAFTAEQASTCERQWSNIRWEAIKKNANPYIFQIVD